MITRIVFSFLVSGSTSILNNVQKKYFFLCGISGVISGLSYDYLVLHNNAAISSLIACIILSICSQFFEQITKTPSLVFTVSGIMPIVPGSLLFKAFNSLATNNYGQAASFGTQAILVGFSIAIGFFINEVFSSVLLNLKNMVKKI